MDNYQMLFTPFRIGGCEIRNRVVLPAMEGTNIIDNMTGPRYNGKAWDYYVERAQNHVGLFVSGMVPVYSMMMGKWLHKSPKAFRQAKPLIDEIHRHGAKVFFQLGAGFAGRNYTIMPQFLKVAENPTLKKLTNPILHLNEMMVGPDEGLPLAWAPQLSTRAITREEIRDYVEGYAKSAKLCKDIGVDGVEVHAVHEGYLMDQFTMGFTNHRTDEYGGSFENRYRFAVEVVQAIKRECGADYPVMLRYSVTSKVIDFKVGAVPGEEFTELGRDMAESERAAKYLQDAGYDALNCDNGTYDSWYWPHPPVYMPPNCNLADAEHISQFVDIPVIVAGKMQPEVAEASIRAGKIDAVGIARQILCDGEYLTKLRQGDLKEVRPCIACHNACLPTAYYKNSGCLLDARDIPTQGHCALNPVAFEEKKYALKQTEHPKTIAVIGGGIAGMQVSLLLSQRGHTVDLYEKTDRLGGVFIAAAAPDFKEKDKELLDWYRLQMARSGVRVHLNTPVRSLADIPAQEYIIATGARARRLNVPGAERAVEAVEYLLGEKTVGDRVAVIGGGLTGCEIAYDLALKGKHPIVVEMAQDLITAPGICAANSNCLRDLLRYHKAEIHLESTLREVRAGSILIAGKDGNREIPCDSVILSVGYTPDRSLAGKGKNIHILGDADGVGNLKKAIWGAYDLGVRL